MIDLALAVILIYIFVKANKGVYKETACNIALVVGILAAVLGFVLAFIRNEPGFAFLNVIVMLIAFGIRFAARHLVKLYHEKEIADAEQREYDAYLHSKFDDQNKAPVYTEDNFDDEELRFGKGGYTDPKL